MTSEQSHKGMVWLCVVLIAIAAGRIASTWGVFSHTYDEVAHLAAGMQWLDTGEYDYERQHPPIARTAIALGPYLLGVRSKGIQPFWVEGQALLYDGNDYARTLTVARLGILPFFVAAAALVGVWGFMLGGPGLGVGSVAVFTLLPPVLAHGSVATTDMAGMVGVLAVMVSTFYWATGPSSKRALVMGVGMGLAATLKFTAPIFGLGAAGLTALASVAMRPGRRPSWLPPLRPLALQAALCGLAAGLVVWAAYGFDVGPVRGIPIPAPDFARGLMAVVEHNDDGQVTFLFGQVGIFGWWYFFPVAIGVKTPLAVLGLAIAGIGLLGRDGWRARDWRLVGPVLLTFVILAVVMTSRINLGVRHALPIYIPFSIAAAYAGLALWRSSRAAARVVAVLLASWLVVDSATAHPDYLADFNELAGGHPEHILVDSDLDWGQDLNRLADTLRARNIQSINLAYYGTARLDRHGLPEVVRFQRDDRPTGWVAISETRLQRGDAYLSPENEWTLYPEAFDWLSAYEPVARVGRSIRLYSIPAESR